MRSFLNSNGARAGQWAVLMRDRLRIYRERINDVGGLTARGKEARQALRNMLDRYRVGVLDLADAADLLRDGHFESAQDAFTRGQVTIARASVKVIPALEAIRCRFDPAPKP